MSLKNKSLGQPFAINLSGIFFIFLVCFTMPCLGQQSEEYIMPGIFQMPEAKVSTVEKTTGVSEAVRMDLHRFMGFEQGAVRYLSLPYDVCQKTNVESPMNDNGFLFLWLLPILFLFSAKSTGISGLITNLSVIALCFLLLLVSVPSTFLNKHNLTAPEEGKAFLEANPTSGLLGNISDRINKTALDFYPSIEKLLAFSGKDNITYPLLIALFLWLIFLFYNRSKTVSKHTQILLFSSLIYFFLWWILGAGAPWYGILIFCLPFIFIVKGMSLPEASFNLKNLVSFTGKSGIFILASGIWLLFAFMYRAAGYQPTNEDRAHYIYTPPITEYQTGNISHDKFLDVMFVNARQVEKIINQTDGFVYKMGGQFNFFIEKNDQRIYDDRFLAFFEKMVRKLRDKNKIIELLKASGFEYLVLDLNLSQSDPTPEKRMLRRFINLMNTLYQNPQIELLYTDRAIRLYNSEQIIHDIFPGKGQLVNGGTVAIFRLK